MSFTRPALPSSVPIPLSNSEIACSMWSPDNDADDEVDADDKDEEELEESTSNAALVGQDTMTPSIMHVATTGQLRGSFSSFKRDVKLRIMRFCTEAS